MNMKPKQMFIIMVIILLATTLLFPKTEEQRYCHQYSGESTIDDLSDEINSCINDNRCNVDEASKVFKETDQDSFTYMCIPINETLSDGIINNSK